MSSYIDTIPQAVATIVSACVAQSGQHLKTDGKEALEKWAVGLTDQVTRTLVKAIRESATESP